MLNTKLIVNLAAGAGATSRKWPQVMKLLESLGLRFEYAITQAPGQATELARDAVRQGCELIVAVGGDGTVSEVVNGLYDAHPTRRAMLGIINTGTGGDFIHAIGIPRSYEQACQRLLNPQKLIVDLGVVECSSNGQRVKRVFVNSAGVGLDAEIVRATDRGFKAFGGAPAYFLGSLRTILTHRNRQVSMTIDGVRDEKRVCAVLTSNCRYSGGGMLPAPNADPADGLLDVLIVGDMSRPDLLWSLPRIYNGRHLTHPKISLKRAKDIEVRSSETMLLQADGELVGEAPARFQVLPAALTVAI